MKVPNKFRWLLLACAVLSGCIKDFNPPCDEVPDEDETIFTEGYSLDFVVTLDALGGDGLSLPYDDYVDTEKFRVFFFTDDDDTTLEEDEKNVFLFESRTRFIKMLPGTSGPSSAWRVSVPLFSYGNGAAAEWNWEKIRRFLREHPFKIALLVNRPESEWSMRIIGKTTATYDNQGKLTWADNPDDVIVPGAWYDNSAPHWEAENTFFGKADPNVVVTDGALDPAIKAEYKGSWKTLLDLHHVQYDPIYFGKSFDVSVILKPDGKPLENDGRNAGLGQFAHNDNKIYNFVAKELSDGTLMMGSTSSWVSWSGYDGELATNPNITGKPAAASDTNRDPYHWSFRRTIHPSQDYPIPMYGIQRFEPIKEWDWGTPVLLDKDIFLLRSVVRLDLYVPEGMTVDFLTLFYSNVFSRCEPMDVWTPTDILWDRYVTGNDRLEKSYEMKQILNYGPITRKAEYDRFGNETDKKDESVQRYQQRMCWLYGIWEEKAGWEWNNFNVNPKDASHKGKVEVDPTTGDLFFPHLFNPCVQRNTTVYCPVGAPQVELEETGEIVQDPDWNDYIGGNTVEVKSDVPGYRRFAIYTGERNINDPSTFTDIGNRNSGRPTVAYFMIGINGSSYSIPLVNYGGGTDNSLGQYTGNPVVKSDHGYNKKPTNTIGNSKDDDSVFERIVMDNPAAGASKLPYPLIRNHVYQFFITRNGTRSGAPEIGVTSAVRRSEYVVRERPEARPEVAPDPAPEE